MGKSGTKKDEQSDLQASSHLVTPKLLRTMGSHFHPAGLSAPENHTSSWRQTSVQHLPSHSHHLEQSPFRGRSIGTGPPAAQVTINCFRCIYCPSLNNSLFCKIFYFKKWPNSLGYIHVTWAPKILPSGPQPPVPVREALGAESRTLPLFPIIRDTRSNSAAQE